MRIKTAAFSLAEYWTRGR